MCVVRYNLRYLRLYSASDWTISQGEVLRIVLFSQSSALTQQSLRYNLRICPPVARSVSKYRFLESSLSHSLDYFKVDSSKKFIASIFTLHDAMNWCFEQELQFEKVFS